MTSAQLLKSNYMSTCVSIWSYYPSLNSGMAAFDECIIKRHFDFTNNIVIRSVILFLLE